MDVSQEIDYAKSFGILVAILAILGLAALLFYLFVLRPLGKYTDETLKKVEEENEQFWAAEQTRQQKLAAAKREREQAVHQKFQREYEQRKQAIGRIVCPQCKWTGNWGDGMSYEEFFIYELVEVNKVRVSRRVDTNIHYLNSESQYKCPMCKSTNWQKV